MRASESWPALPYDEWKDTYATLHMWMQVVGKVALAQAPPINHSWAIAMRVTPRGITTLPLPHGHRSFTMEFDFLQHRLVILTSDGDMRALPLAPMSGAGFYREVMATLQAMSLPVKIWPVAVEVPDPIRLDEDVQHHSYVAEQANRFWRILVQVERVFGVALHVRRQVQPRAFLLGQPRSGHHVIFRPAGAAERRAGLHA